ncbi:glutathione-dependent formaldehyde-activating, GFA [Shewanella sediminis HAW-EB3]|uniref:Glutathione-dependent formaldehyde-activating, GFA n=1 Tax=Shewanella sediminis (strain HAW-EB3) TaxID=425104 RepID=A8FW42_SHESH|nr:GFA family protein [Shewanella sediminis]ABV37065.1 glutathione-dependent formaldehyde-activating, GFA [Shewanella sediminis HAW-EB3]
MSAKPSFQGSCFCGAVQFTVKGTPNGMGYCHCESCRKWSAGPVNAFTLWEPEAISITAGADKISSFNKTPGSTRKWCSECGGHIMTEHPTMNLIDVFAASIPSLKFEPGIHVHYQESVLPIKDGLPKMKDMPSEAGGSGETMPE